MPKINHEEYEILKRIKDEVGSMIIPIKYDTNGYDNSGDIHDYNEALVDVILTIDEIIDEKK